MNQTSPSPSGVDAHADSPLAGLKVVEIGVAMAGPFCGMTLGDYGADVIKVERIDVGDDSRAWPPHFHGELGYYYAAANRNKRCIALDLKDPDGVAIARELIGQADILVNNYRLGALERAGLDWPSLQAANPRLIYCGISGFGASGPLSAEPANDLFMQAYSGGMSITGEPDGNPAKMGVSIADIGAGMFGTIGILMALEARHRTGRGQRVDTSLLEGQIAMLAHFLTRHFATGEVPGPSGSGALTSPIYRAFKGTDDWIVISAFNEKMWHGLARALERPQWINDPRFCDARVRVQNRHLLIELIAEIIKDHPVAIWQARLKENGVPCSPVNKIDRVVQQEQVLERDMVAEFDVAGLGPIRMAGLPIKLSETGGSIRLAPPRLGQHTREVLTELGYASQRIDALAERHVIGLDSGWAGTQHQA